MNRETVKKTEVTQIRSFGKHIRSTGNKFAALGHKFGFLNTHTSDITTDTATPNTPSVSKTDFVNRKFNGRKNTKTKYTAASKEIRTEKIEGVAG